MMWRSEMVDAGNEVHLEAGCWGRDRAVIGQWLGYLIIGARRMQVWLEGLIGRSCHSSPATGDRGEHSGVWVPVDSSQ
jgi:hypothetical protein